MPTSDDQNGILTALQNINTSIGKLNTVSDKYDTIIQNKIPTQSLADLYQVVQTRPTTGMKEGLVYLVVTETQNVYNAWTYENGNWLSLGQTAYPDIAQLKSDVQNLQSIVSSLASDLLSLSTSFETLVKEMSEYYSGKAPAYVTIPDESE